MLAYYQARDETTLRDTAPSLDKLFNCGWLDEVAREVGYQNGWLMVDSIATAVAGDWLNVNGTFRDWAVTHEGPDELRRLFTGS